MLEKERHQEEEETQQTLTHLIKPKKKYDHRNPKQISAQEALVDFIADDLMPLSLVESVRFRKFASILDPQYQLPSRKHLSTVLLAKKYDDLKKKLRDKLEKVSSVNLTIDLWSNRQMRSYFGITGHYISNEWNLESFVLGCNRVVGRHTAENLMLWYDEIVSDFCVSEKVKHVITDSAANIKKAFTSLPGFEVESDSDNVDEDESDDCDDTGCADESIFTENLLLEHHSCFAHCIQLVVKDGLAKAGQIGSIIKKCSKLVSFVRKSTIAADVLKDDKRLQADNVTRWNSQLKMIRSLLAIEERKLLEIEDAPKLTSHERLIYMIS